MLKPCGLYIVVGALLTGGCASQSQLLAGDQDMAIQTAERRGQFELGCPEAKGTVLSSNMLQPVLWRGEERAEYTVGIEGCGKRKTYVVVCPLGSSGCLAGLGSKTDGAITQ
jgi:hypothetical protein